MTNRQIIAKAICIQLLTVSCLLTTSSKSIEAVAGPLPLSTAWRGETYYTRSVFVPHSSLFSRESRETIRKSRETIFAFEDDGYSTGDSASGESLSSRESTPPSSRSPSRSPSRSRSRAPSLLPPACELPPAVWMMTSVAACLPQARSLRRSRSSPNLSEIYDVFTLVEAPRQAISDPITVPKSYGSSGSGVAIARSAPSAYSFVSSYSGRAGRGAHSQPPVRGLGFRLPSSLPREVGHLTPGGLLLRDLYAVEAGLVIAEDVTLSPSSTIALTHIDDAAFPDFSRQLKGRQLSPLLENLADQLEAQGTALPLLSLHLQSGKLDEAGLLNLSRILSYTPHLTSLTIALDWSVVTLEKGHQTLAKALSDLSSLKKVRIENKAETMFVSMSGPTLLDVTLELIKGLEGKSIEDLSLVSMIQSNDLVSESVQRAKMLDIFQRISSGNALKSLNLSGNYLCSGSVKALANALESSRNLESLNLSSLKGVDYSVSGESGKDGLMPVFSLLPSWPLLKELFLNGMNPGEEKAESMLLTTLHERMSRGEARAQADIVLSASGLRAVVTPKTPLNRLCDKLPDTALETFALQGVALTTEYAEKLLRALPWHSLSKIDFGGNLRGDIERMSRFGPELLTEKLIDIRGILEEVIAKKQGKNLQQLDLSVLLLSKAEVSAIVALCLENLTSLSALKINSYVLDEETKISLRKLVHAAESDGRKRFELIFIELPC